MSDDPGSSRRQRRAVSLIAAVAVIVLVGVLYLRSIAPAPSGALPPASIPTMSGPYSATYDFVTPLLGWALVIDYSAFSTKYWIFKTTDGARHWQVQHTGQAEGGQTYLHFFDDKHGFAYAGFSYRTVDGGAHWQTVDVPGSTPYFTFASPTLGWAEGFEVGTKRLYITTDGGVTWTVLPSKQPAASVLEPIFEIQSSAFQESGEGWLGAGLLPAPVVYLTVDRGATWRTITLPSPSGSSSRPGQTSPRLLPGDGVVVMVSDDAIHIFSAFFSSDRGASWRTVTFPVAVSTSDDLSFVDATHWWLLQRGQVYKTTNSGAAWTYVSPLGLPAGWRFERARVIDADHAWWAMVSSARSTNSALAITSDGGEHWKMVGVPQPH